jgi:hypothetical protein
VQRDASKNLRLFELARLLVRFNQVASFIVNANHGILLTVQDDLRSSFAYVKLCAHFLELWCLLFHRRSQGCNFLLQLQNSGSLLLHCLVLFEELVEHHIVDRLVSEAFDFPLDVADSQLGIYFSNILGDQASDCGLGAGPQKQARIRWIIRDNGDGPPSIGHGPASNSGGPLPPAVPVSLLFGQNVTNQEGPIQGSSGENEPCPSAEK